MPTRISVWCQLVFPWYLMMLNTSVCIYLSPISLLCEESVQIFCPFFNWECFIFLLLNCKSSLHSLVPLLHQIRLLLIFFSQFVAQLFIVLHCHWTSRSFQFWQWSIYCVIFSFIDCVYYAISKRAFSPSKVTKNFSYMFFWRSYTFMSYIRLCGWYCVQIFYILWSIGCDLFLF